MDSRTPVISIAGISKVYESDTVETHAVSDISLDVDVGEFIALTGPSGCGKSTLLGILGLLDEPTSGRYRLNGADTTGMGFAELAHARNEAIGFIFQSFNIINSLNIIENVELPLTYRRGMSRKERAERASRMLDLVGMSHRAEHYPSELSGGQQQRVAIARALVTEPGIILADEPTGNLDSKNGEVIMELLHGIHQGGATICMVTHDAAFAQSAQRVIHLLDGKMIRDEEGARRACSDNVVPFA